MTECFVTHDTFSIELPYPVPPSKAFAAFASEEARNAWGRRSQVTADAAMQPTGGPAQVNFWPGQQHRDKEESLVQSARVAAFSETRCHRRSMAETMKTVTNAIVAEPIPTRRLILVPLAAEHADEMAAALADPQLYAFTGGSPPSRQVLRARYERWVAGSPDPAVSWCNWVIWLRSQRCLTGTVQATISTGDELMAEVAWVVGLPWQGQGIATEAAQALIAWLGQRSVQTVVAHIHPRHHASAAVAAAAGLTPTGQTQDGETRWLLTTTPTPRDK